MRTMYDSVSAGSIPTTAQMVAGYVDGRYAWSAEDWARVPNAIKVRIAVFASTNDGHVLDVERSDATPAQAVGWVQRRRAAGVDPTVYCGYSTNGYSWALVIDAFKSARCPEPHYWVAAYPGNGPNLYPGSVAHQYANPLTSGGGYDLSVVADYWPGVDAVVGGFGSGLGTGTYTPLPPITTTTAAPSQEDLMRPTMVTTPSWTAIFITTGNTGTWQFLSPDDAAPNLAKFDVVTLNQVHGDEYRQNVIKA